MAYNPNFKFNPKYSSKEAIESEKINMGAMFYLHLHGLLMELSQARLENDCLRFYYALDALFMQARARISDSIDEGKIDHELGRVEQLTGNYSYLKYCSESGEGNSQATQQLRPIEFQVWRLSKKIFRQIYNVMNAKGMILPDNASDNIGKYLQEFGINAQSMLKGNDASKQ